AARGCRRLAAIDPVGGLAGAINLKARSGSSMPTAAALPPVIRPVPSAATVGHGSPVAPDHPDRTARPAELAGLRRSRTTRQLSGRPARNAAVAAPMVSA